MTEAAFSLLLIPLVPLAGALLSYVVGQARPRWSGWVASGAAMLSFVLVLMRSAALTGEATIETEAFDWVSLADLQLGFLLRFDSLASVMCLVVTGVGSLIHVYATGYMADDPSRARFFAYFNLFLFAMLLLVLGGSLPVLFIGWEGVGLCSYLLIGFWHQNEAFARAGRKAFVVNRIGDAGFLIGMFILFSLFQTLDMAELKNLLSERPVEGVLLSVAALALFVGATGKSAQIPLFVWLPDAMAGPTPVSALIHAATMVTAGVYMMARLSFLYELVPEVMVVVACIALLTALVAGTIALVQNDIKKVLAYSTISQLGLMFMAASAGAAWVAIFHVVTHAFFKACLFLGAGSVIHACHHEQDMRRLGGLLRKMPITGWTYLVAALAIAGIAPLAGYYSKHAISEAVAATNNPLLQPLGQVFVPLLTLAALITAVYIMRSFVMTFLGEYRGHAEVHESPRVMTLTLVVLAVLSFFGGVALVAPLSIASYLESSLVVSQVPQQQALLPALLHSWPGILGAALAWWVYARVPILALLMARFFAPFFRLLSRKYYVDELYAACVVRPLEGLARWLAGFVDQAVIDGFVNSSANVIDASGEVIRSAQTGQVRHYAALMLGIGLLLVAVLMVW